MIAALPIGVDTETYLIDTYQLAPKMVCLTTSTLEHKSIASTGDGMPVIAGTLNYLFGDYQLTKVFHNAGFDLAVIAASMPELLPAIFDHLDRGLVEDTLTREKLLNLADTGDLEFSTLPGGGKMHMEYHLAQLVNFYLGIDISATKKGSDIWRLNYKALDGIPTAQWPEDAVTYAVDDPDYTLRVRNEQEKRRNEIIQRKGVDPFVTQALQVRTSFVLYLITCNGICTDAAEKEKIEVMLAEELKPENVALLVQYHILRPAEPPHAYANGAKNPDGSPKMTKGEAERENKTALRTHIQNLAIAYPDKFTVKMTAASDRFPHGQVCTNDDWMEDHAHLDPVLGEYRHRAKLQKLVTTYIPAMNDAQGNTSPIVYFAFNTIVRTGRTSSYSHGLVPSTNGQNIDYRVRNCFLPRPGFLLCSNDFSGMELVTFAQKCLTLFGKSKLADLLNAGIDAHEYLAAQIAYHSDDHFRGACLETRPAGMDQDEIYSVFHKIKDDPRPQMHEFWKHYRNLAKPTGLGYPGGLGPKTFMVFAKTQFGVMVDLLTATKLRDIWRQTFPEVLEYHAWINNSCIDPFNAPTIKVDEHGIKRASRKYSYMSPLGMLRAGCDFCAAANGAALQTPSSEASKIAIYNSVRGCYDWTRNSLLYPDQQGVTCNFLAFIHDELLSELRDDSMAHDRAFEISNQMIAAMRIITPDVQVKNEPTLMRRWDKAAETVYDANGRLYPWEPKQAIVAS